MAKQIFNENNYVEMPTLLLQNRNFNTISNITNVHDFVYKENFNSANEISFTFYRENNEKNNEIWEQLVDLKIIYIPEYRERFEIDVSVSDTNVLVKNVIGTSLCEAELSQTLLRDININNEIDILNPLYDVNFPTVFYRVPDIREYDFSGERYRGMSDEEKLSIIKHASLLHRLLEKVPHYSIKHVDATLINIQREFTFSGTDVYSALNNTVSEEIGCLFIFDSIDRGIYVYDLYNTCYNDDCSWYLENNKRYRGDFIEVCPQCGNKHISGMYGKDTTIFINKNNLSSSIDVESNKDEVKNCFYVEGGDELINSAIANCNPNGSQYIYNFSKINLDDMSNELRERLADYNKLYEEYMTTHIFNIDEQKTNEYNEVVEYVMDKFKDEPSINYHNLTSEIIGFPNTTTALYESIDLYYFVKTSMMPTLNISGDDIDTSMNNIINGFASGFRYLTEEGIPVTGFTNEVALLNNTVSSSSTVENAISRVARMFYGKAYYNLDVTTESYTKAETKDDYGIWQGVFTLTSLTEKEEITGLPVTKISNLVTLKISSNYELYVEQCIYRAMGNKSEKELKEKGMTSLNMSEDDFKEKLILYSYDELDSLKQMFVACLDVVTDGFNDTAMEGEYGYDDLKNKYYNFYYNRLNFISDELEIRDEQIQKILGIYDFVSENSPSGELYTIREVAKNTLNIKKYLGDYYDTFCAYRREDTYTNANYISDGLNNAQAIDKAMKLLDTANNELLKASELQCSIAGSLHNLLVLPEFQIIKDYFEVGNWIRIGVDDSVYKLRLLSYQIKFNDIQNIDIEFSTVKKISNSYSDITSVIESAKSMATTYSSVYQQSEKSKDTNKTIADWVTDGLKATQTKFANSDSQDIQFDSNGILCRRYNDVYEDYSPYQLKIVSNGLYTTNDSWETINTGIGRISYTDPRTNTPIETYGVIARYIVGDVVVGKEFRILSQNNSITLDENGITLDGGKITWTQGISTNAITDIYSYTMNQLVYFQNTVLGSNVTEITSNSVISPKIGGGYLYIAQPGYPSVEINPLADLYSYSGKTGYIFNIKNSSGSTVMGVDSGGNAYFSGNINGSNISGGVIEGAAILGGSLNIGNNAFHVGTTGELTATSANLKSAVILLNQYGKIAGYIRMVVEESISSGDYVGTGVVIDSASDLYLEAYNNIYVNGSIVASRDWVRTTIESQNYITSSDLSSYATKSYVDNGLSGKSSTGHSHSTRSLTASSGSSTNGTYIDIGGINVPSTSWVRDYHKTTDPSDRKIKQNIKSLNDITNDFMNLKPVSYNFIDAYIHNAKTEFGFIAQDVAELYPQSIYGIVGEVNDVIPGESTPVWGNNHLTLNYNSILAMTVQMVQKQQIEIANLKQIINDLKGENDA